MKILSGKCPKNVLSERTLSHPLCCAAFTRGSGAQHPPVVYPHGAVGAAHGQVIRDRWANRYRRGRPSAVN